MLTIDVRNVHHGLFSLRYSDGSAMLSSSLIQVGFLEPWRNVLDSGDQEPVFEAIERELNRVALNLGELRLTVPWVCMDIRKPVEAPGISPTYAP